LLNVIALFTLLAVAAFPVISEEIESGRYASPIVPVFIFEAFL